MSAPRRVLLRLPNWLGDVCFAAPAVEAIAAALPPDGRLVVAARASVAALAARLRGVHAVIRLEEGAGPRALLDLVRRYREVEADAAVVFPRSFRAALPIALARIPRRVGFPGEGRRALLTQAVRPPGGPRGAHRSEGYAALLAPLGVPPPTAPWRFVPDADSLAWTDAWLAAAPARRSGRPLVAMEPGGAYGVAKRWPAERYAALASRLVREDRADVVLVGTAEAAPLHAEVAARAGVPLLLGAGATDLPRLAALLSRAALLVTNDTGPMHLAAALGTPLLALFGSTDPAFCAPRGEGRLVVLYERVACSPCWRRTCPVPGHPCLDRFEVDRVWGEARALLRGAG